MKMSTRMLSVTFTMIFVTTVRADDQLSFSGENNRDFGAAKELAQAIPKKKQQATTAKRVSKRTTDMPAAPAEVKPKKLAPDQEIDVQLVPPECVPSGLNTIDSSGGNWLLKRGIWEQAQRMYEKISAADKQLYAYQLEYNRTRADVDKNIDTAFRVLGFEQGQLEGLLDKMRDELKQEQERQGSLDQRERQLMQVLKDKDLELKQLQLDLKAVAALDEAIDKTIDQMEQQVGVCHEYNSKAWEHYKSIGEELNDRAAMVLFYEMDGYLKTVEQNVMYVGGQLVQYLSENVAQIKQHLSEIQTKTDNLKSKGTDLGQELKRLTKQEDVQTVERTKKQQEEDMIAAIEKAKKDAEQAREKASLWYRVKNQSWRAWTALVDLTASAYHQVASWFGFGRAKTAA